MRRIATLALLACLGLGCDDMGLPSTREITAAPNTDIPSAVLNVVQDAIIGMKHPEAGIPIHAADFKSVGANAGVWSPGGAGAFWGPGAGGSVWVCAVRMPIGDRLTRVRFAYRRSSGGGDTTIGVAKMTSAGVSTTLATFTDATHDGTDQIKELAAINYTLAVDEYVEINISIGDNTGPGRVYGATPYSDKL